MATIVALASLIAPCAGFISVHPHSAPWRAPALGSRALPFAVASKSSNVRPGPLPRAAAPLQLRAVSQDVSNVLLRYGVAEADHEALIGELAPLLGGAPPVSAFAKVETLEIAVVRSEAGGLGIDVDKSNVIQASPGQKTLQVGDRVIAIDGVPLGSKFVAQGLEPGKPQYTFTVERGG
jgi:hypothetical protein